MALPLKSGADLYNQQLIRAAIWNYSADGIDPREYSTGLMYFNTNPSSNMYQKLRFRTGSEWKTIAFAEDLDVASNADFVALKEKVELLSGDVDTDAIISNMKEVTAFLEGFAEDANLMEALNKKLDKTGGTITGNLQIGAADNTSYNYLQLTRSGKGIRINNIEDRAVISFGSVNSSGGFSAISTLYFGPSLFEYSNDGTNYYNILHSGNIGSQTAGAAKKLNVPYASAIGEDKVFTVEIGKADLVYSIPSNYKGMFPSINYGNTVFRIPRSGDGGGALLGFSGNGYIYYRRTQDTDWKQLAFTDSDITGYAAGLKHSNGTVGAVVNSSGNVTIGGSDKASSHKLWVDGNTNINGTLDVNGSIYLPNASVLAIKDASGTNAQILTYSSSNELHLGYGNRDKGTTSIWGKELQFKANSANALIINSSGIASFASRVNVGGATDDASYKLNILGNQNLKGFVNFTDGASSVRIQNGHIRTILLDEGGWGRAFTCMHGEKNLARYGFYGSGENLFWMALGYDFAKPWMAILPNGKVGIGITSPSAQLHVKEDIVADGTIACKGIAEVGTTAAEGTVDKHAEVIEAGQQSYTINHQLHTKEITVCIYEMGGEETVLILTDVTVVSDDVIRVEFGRTTDVKHRVVVMG